MICRKQKIFVWTLKQLDDLAAGFFTMASQKKYKHIPPSNRINGTIEIFFKETYVQDKNWRNVKTHMIIRKNYKTQKYNVWRLDFGCYGKRESIFRLPAKKKYLMKKKKQANIENNLSFMILLLKIIYMVIKYWLYYRRTHHIYR